MEIPKPEDRAPTDAPTSGEPLATPGAMSGHGPAEAAESAFADVTRADLPGLLVRRLNLERKKSAAMWYVESDGARAVLKDYRGSGLFWRCTLGPLVIPREVRALRDLGARGIAPRLLRVIDRRAFIMEAVTGELCSRLDAKAVGPAFFAGVADAIDALHAAGWVHCDLKSFGNLIRLPGERIVIIDFATAFSREGWGGGLRRRLFEQAARLDRMALAKLKTSLSFPELLTEEERHFLAHPPWTVRLARCYRRVYGRIRGRKPPPPSPRG
jgi:hypothetical protein